MSKIRIGPAGLGGVEEAIKNLENFKSLGFGACEIAFTYSVYLNKNEAVKIGEVAKKLDIQLSIHAPYFINLNSEENSKIENSKKRLLSCLEIGHYLGAKYVVFHPGFYGKSSKEESYKNIKEAIFELEKIRKEKGYTPKLAPEIMGKINVFGSPEEIARLVRDTGCHACIDFAHVYARNQGKYKFQEILGLFKDMEELHVHFSGMIYGDKGERKHKPTETKEWKDLIKNLPKGKKITIINESPTMIEDCIEGIKYL